MPRPEAATGTAEASQNSDVESLVIDQLFADEVNNFNRGEQKSSAPVPASQENDSEDEELEFSMPNGDIRYNKLKAKEAATEQKYNEAMQRLAKLEGLVIANNKASAEPEVDPTEGMTANEKVLFRQNQEMAAMLNKVVDKVGSLDKVNVEGRLRVEEEKFFSENPDLQENREEVASQIVDYLRSKPELLKMVRDRKMSIKEAYAAMAANQPAGRPQAPAKKVQNPASVFTGERRGSAPATPPNNGGSAAAALERANYILESKRGSASENAEAFDVVSNKVYDWIGGIVEKQKQMYQA